MIEIIIKFSDSIKTILDIDFFYEKYIFHRRFYVGAVDKLEK